MPISDKDILQIDATVIAGILILMTVSSFAITPQNHVQNNILPNMSPTSLAGLLIVPFSLSAILSIIHSQFETNRHHKLLVNIEGGARGGMIGGFCYLFGFAIYFAFWM
jgi:hypothetical protein